MVVIIVLSSGRTALRGMRARHAGCRNEQINPVCFFKILAIKYKKTRTCLSSHRDALSQSEAEYLGLGNCVAHYDAMMK